MYHVVAIKIKMGRHGISEERKFYGGAPTDALKMHVIANVV